MNEKGRAFFCIFCLSQDSSGRRKCGSSAVAQFADWSSVVLIDRSLSLLFIDQWRQEVCKSVEQTNRRLRRTKAKSLKGKKRARGKTRFEKQLTFRSSTIDLFQ